MDRRTLCARGTGKEIGSGEPLAPPIVTSSTFGFSSQGAIEHYYETGEGYVYSRYGNPTVRGVEQLLAQLEGGEDAALFASGMAAISTLFLTMAGAGQKVAAQEELYGGSAHLLRSVLPGMGIEVQWFSREQLAQLTPEKLRGCRLLYLETPINPILRLVDLSRAAAVARKAGVPVAVDGTFAPPVVQRPLELGIDLVVHSATKYLGGHADLVGGVIAGSTDRIREISLRRREMGGTMDAFSAFLLQRGIRTLAVRMEAHARTAQVLAQELARHPRVESVYYPGLPDHPDREIAERQMTSSGGMLSFRVSGTPGAGVLVLDRLRLFVRAGSLGGVESLVSIPARMSHRYLSDPERASAGIDDNLVRLSIGLESPEDLLGDLTQALDGLD